MLTCLNDAAEDILFFPSKVVGGSTEGFRVCDNDNKEVRWLRARNERVAVADGRRRL